MKCELIKNNGGDALIIFFAGWSSCPLSLKSFRPEGWDVLFVYDYSDLQMPVEAIAAMTEYKRFALVAHSFGVAVAHSFIDILPECEMTVAVCGTLYPVHDKYGIPQRVFKLTERGIAKEGINQFNLKMCGDKIKDFTPSKLDFKEQCAALSLLGETFTSDKELEVSEINKWKVAVICMKDTIIPVDNQIAFWGTSQAEVVGFKNSPHFPFNAPFSQFIASLL